MPAPYSRRCWFTFPTSSQVEQPIIWQMSRKFPDVVFDIRQASVQASIGIMAVLLTGTEADVQAAIEFVRAAGVTVEPIEKSVVEG
jgi:ABC-type methionine transport system ATPase subunit